MKVKMWVGIFTVLLASGIVVGAPSHGNVHELKQPDGSLVPVKIWGDEFYQRVEGLDGYTLVRDRASGWICYAEVTEDGTEFVSTGQVYEVETDLTKGQRKVQKMGKKLPKQKHLKLKKSAVHEKAKKRRKELLGEKADEYVNFGMADDGTFSQQAIAQATAPAPLIGSVVGLTVLVDFPDEPGTISVTEVDNYCNQVGYTGYNNNGSIRDYFYDISNGNLEYTNQVVGYYTTRYNKSYYDNCEGGRTHELIDEALDWLEAQNFDFTSLSTEGNNEIIALNFFYAGGPDCGWAKGLWPHMSWHGREVGTEGVRTATYQISGIGSSLVLGTFCHENGHMVGDWPDLYDYGYESSGTGGYCLMSSGHGTNPQPPNPHFRNLRGWEYVIDITGDLPGTVRTHTANSHTTFRYSHPTDSREFFLVESRRRIGRNSNIPDDGMLIWHVDEDGSNNNEQMTPESHYLVSVEQADGRFDLENGSNGGGSGDLFHAGYRDTFDDGTLPDARWWDGSESGLGIRNIGPVDSTMSFAVGNVPVNLLITPGYQLELNHTWSLPLNNEIKTFELTNTSDSSLSWSVSKNANWYNINPIGGTLASGGTVKIQVSLNSAASALGPDEYFGTVAIADLTNDVVVERQVALTVRPKGLYAHWQFDETSGYSAGDSTGNGFTGELQNTSFAAGTTAGKFGKALNFDGDDDFITVRDLNIDTNHMTVTGWVNTNVIQTEYTALIANRVGGTAANFNFKTSNRLGYHWNDSDFTWTWSSSLAVPTSKWVFVAMVVEPSRLTMYMDDGVPHSQTRFNLTHALERFAGETNIGWDPHTSDRNYEGTLDDLRIYNYALTSDEIALVKQGGRAECPQPANGSTDVPPRKLEWIGSPVAVGYNVYVGSSYAEVNGAAPGSPEFLGYTTENQQEIGWKPDSIHFWRVDVVTGTGTIKGAVWQFETGDGTGAITREIWNGIGGNYVSDLTSSSRYPDQPDSTDIVTSLEGPVDVAENYGSRLHGYLIPQVSGSYKFWIAGDDYCQLWLSSNAEQANITRIAEVPGATGHREWYKYTQQESNYVNLVAGNKYYIRVLHKEGIGGDHVSVAWQGPGMAQQVIAGNYLMPWIKNQPPRLTAKPVVLANAVERASYSQSLLPWAYDAEAQDITFMKTGGPDWLDVSAVGTVYGVPGDLQTGPNFFTVRLTDASGASSENAVQIHVVDKFTGENGLEDFAGLSSQWEQAAPDLTADLDLNGSIDLADLSIFASNWLVSPVGDNMFLHITCDADSQGNPIENNLLYFGDAAVTEDTVKKGSGAVVLDGDGDYVEVPGVYGISGSQSRTVTAWIKTAYQPGDTTDGEMVSWGDEFSTGRKWITRINNDGTLRQEVAGGFICGRTIIADNEWHHIGIVLEDDGSADIEEVLLYVDGQQETTYSSACQIDTAVLAPVRLGRCTEVPVERFFKGYMDEVRIYDRALTPEEISYLAQ